MEPFTPAITMPSRPPFHRFSPLESAPALALFAFFLALTPFAQTLGSDSLSNPASEPTVLAVAKTMPAVVNINTERIVRRTVRDPYDDFFNNFFGGPMRPPRTLKQTVQSLGSGFLVDSSGYILTNEHVVERAADLKISVTTPDGKTYDARYITGSAEHDLALLKIEAPAPLPFISPEELSGNYLGQTVLVLGNPLGYGSSVARGILSAKGRTITVGEVEYRDLVQTDAAINPGHSGGPLVDLAGKLVGVSSVKMAFTPQGLPTQGLGFAISGEVVRRKVAEFKEIASGRGIPPRQTTLLSRKYFGLQLQDFTPELRESFGNAGGAGVLVAAVDLKSPAQEAGLKQGLVIHQIGRYQVSSLRQVEDVLRQVGPGSTVDFTVGILRRVRGQSFIQTQMVSLKAR
jgi:serine protease Do